MGIYSIEHFEKKEDAVKYYTDGMNHFSNKIVTSINKWKETNDKNYLAEANHAANLVKIFYEHYEEAESRRWE